MKFGIIGAGHAGVKAAETLHAAGHEAVLYSNENAVPYYRPKIIAYAFRQADADELLIHPQAWYSEHRIDLRLDEPVLALDPQKRSIKTARGEESFDAVLLTSGAGPFVPPITQGATDRVLPLWTLHDAARIAERTGDGMRLAIIGGGILGIEAALRALAIGVRVTVIERLPRLLPLQFGEAASKKLHDILTAYGVEVITAGAVSSVCQNQQTLTMELEGRNPLTMDLVVISVGSRRNMALAQQAGLRIDRGILVDEQLSTSAPGIYAAGDIVQIPGLNRCSALDATIQGRLAAANAMAALTNGAQAVYKLSDAAVNYKFNEFELHSVGRVAGEGDHEQLVDADEKACRIKVTDRDGKLVGVQMIGTGQDFKKWSTEVAGE